MVREKSKIIKSFESNNIPGHYYVDLLGATLFNILM